VSLRTLDAKTVTALLKDATAAPSIHNAQPWKFRFLRGDSTIQVHADLDRAMPRADPATRALHLSCAAALFNLRVAAAHAGWEPATQLQPDPANPRLLAEVRLTSPTAPDNDLASLYGAIHRRRTSRHPFTDEAIPGAIKDALRGVAHLEGARLIFPEAWHVQTLLDLVQDAEGRDTRDYAAAEELRHWTRVGTDVLRDFAGRRSVPGREAAAFEGTPQLAVLGTTDDEPRDWLLAGQAMERVLLQATLDGLATSLTSQALEWPELRWTVRDPQSAMGFVQMVLRLGYGPSGPATARRPVDEVLDIE
jgi:hypothetical protein